MILATITLDLFAVLLGGAIALLPMFAEQILHEDAAFASTLDVPSRLTLPPIPAGDVSVCGSSRLGTSSCGAMAGGAAGCSNAAA